MQKLATWAILLATVFTCHLPAQVNPCGPTPCQDAGVAYEQSIDQQRLATVVVVGVAVTALIVVALLNSRCNCSH